MNRNSEYVTMFNMDWTKPEAIRAQVDKIRRIDVGSATVTLGLKEQTWYFQRQVIKVVKVMQFYLIWIYPNSQMAMACHGHETRIAGIVTKKHWQLGRSSKAEEHGVRLLIQDTVLQGHQVGVIGVSHRKYWSWWQMKELKKLRCIQVCISLPCWFSWWMHFVQNRRATSGTSFQLKFLFAPLGMNGLHKCIHKCH